MRITVVLSAYQQPDWLEKSLWGWSRQRFRGFELIVADDGSTEDVAHVIEKHRDEAGMELRHVWQEDDGFRKCRILNKAVAAATGDYLVFSDGDCVPRSDFLAVHASLARPGRFLSGGYVKLSDEASRRIDRSSVDSGGAFAAGWLGRRGVRNLRGAAKLRMPEWARPAADFLATTRPTWNGHNSSAWRRDVEAVNGFDERMAYGGEDREMGLRLENLGVRGLQVRYRALCVHLEHERSYVDAAALAKNRAIRNETRAKRATWTPFGIAPSRDSRDGESHGAAPRLARTAGTVSGRHLRHGP